MKKLSKAQRHILEIAAAGHRLYRASGPFPRLGWAGGGPPNARPIYFATFLYLVDNGLMIKTKDGFPLSYYEITDAGRAALGEG